MSDSDDPVMGRNGRILLPVAVVTAIVSAAWVVRGGLADLQLESQLQTQELVGIKEDVRELKDAVDIAAADRWQRAEMAAFARALERLNAAIGLQVPEVKEAK